MPANVINGLITFLGEAANLNANIWDGEVPRYDINGQPIDPQSPPVDWPAIKLYMDEAGFQLQWTTEDPLDEVGNITIKVWALTRAQCEALVISIWMILAGETNWREIDYGGNPTNPNFQIQMLLERWTCVQDGEQRTAEGSLLYRGDMYYKCQVHTATSTG